MSTPTPNNNSDPIAEQPSFIANPVRNDRPHVPSVTQTQESSEHLHALTDNTAEFTAESSFHPFATYHEPDYAYQSPARIERTTTVPNVPTVASPAVRNICGTSILAEQTAKGQKRRSVCRAIMTSRQKRQKTPVKLSAEDNVFSFIRNSAIDAIAMLHDNIITDSKFEAAKKQAYRHWPGNATRRKLSFAPFEELQSSMETALYQPISHAHNRLLLEEMMLIPPRATFVCAVNADHYFLKQSFFKKKIKEAIDAYPTKPLILCRKVFFTFDLTVVSNPTKDDFEQS